MSFSFVVESMRSFAVTLGIIKNDDALQRLQARGNKICGSSEDWILMFNQSTYNITIFNVLTAVTAKIPQVPSLSNKNHVVHKAVLCCGTGTVLVIFGEKKKLAFYDLRTKRWTPLKEAAGAWYDDVICHEGEFFAVDEYGKVVHYQFDYGRNVRQLVSRWCFFGQKFNLVLVEEDLFLIIRYVSDNSDHSCRLTNLLKVYVLLDNHKFAEVANLSKWAILLGQIEAVALPARSSDGLTPNCIYFRDDSMHMNDQPGDMRVFCMEDKCVDPMQGGGADKLHRIWKRLYLA